jgi:uncharacterized membrane protein
LSAVDDAAGREAELESRWEAAPAVLCVIALQLGMTVVSQQGGWKLWWWPWWAWLFLVVPEALLFLSLAWSAPRRQLDQLGHRRTAALALFGVVSFGNGVALVALMGSLLGAHEKSGTQLLVKGATIWVTNVIAFGLWYWAFDRGGPVGRRQPDPPPPDFQFPQLENPRLAAPGWHPRLFDYIYLSFTNSVAFSPTDLMPLTGWAKALMLTESAASAMTVLLVAARAVNILR